MADQGRIGLGKVDGLIEMSRKSFMGKCCKKFCSRHIRVGIDVDCVGTVGIYRRCQVKSRT